MSSEFSSLDAITSIHRPVSTSTDTDPTQPALVVICSWLGAAPKHIAKYTNGYKLLFPKSTILLIRAEISGFFLGSDLTSACDAIESVIYDSVSETKGPIVLHAFSNGGATNAIRLATQLAQRHIRLPFDTLILDSCPGRVELISGTDALAHSLPNQAIIRDLGWYLVFVAFRLYALVFVVFQFENPGSRLRRLLNDPSLLGSTPRLYLYSKGDAIVDFHHIHEHAEEARCRGYAIVREVSFEKAPHCALLNEDSGRYWGAVSAHISGDGARFKQRGGRGTLAAKMGVR